MAWEHFSVRARKAMALANQEAQRFNHELIDTEHILLGLILEGSGVAANVLKNLGVDLRALRRALNESIEPGDAKPTGENLSQTPRAKKVIEYAVEEARNLNHNYVGTEHLMLGLLRGGDTIAAKMLARHGVTLEAARRGVRELLGIAEPAP